MTPDWNSPTDEPTVPGYYAVLPHLSDRPIVVWWSQQTDGWRNGMQRIRIDGWMGPFPLPPQYPPASRARPTAVRR